MLLVCISLMISGVENLFTYLLDIWVSFKRKWLFRFIPALFTKARTMMEWPKCSLMDEWVNKMWICVCVCACVCVNFSHKKDILSFSTIWMILESIEHYSKQNSDRERQNTVWTHLRNYLTGRENRWVITKDWVRGEGNRKWLKVVNE